MWLLQICVAAAVAVSIAISVGLAWAMLFVAADLAYAWWRIKVSARRGKGQKGSESSWSRTLR